MRARVDWFLLGLVAATALAWILPIPGARGGALHPELINKIGVSLIFFLHGAGLAFAALRSGVMRWRLHLLVQSATFLIFPILGWGVVLMLGDQIPAALSLGIFYLCALPSTVSSSVALTAAARGNVALSLFNATLSSLIGVVATPFWVGLILKAGGQSLPFGQVIVDLLLWLVLPLAVGQALRPWLGRLIDRHKKGVSVIDRLIILFLVYTSFCDSVKTGVWSGNAGTLVLLILALSVGLLALLLSLLGALCTYAGISFEDRIAVVFCGSKKTLASGVPMANLIFGAHPGLGLILLPILVYHPLQLLVCASLAARWARRIT